MRAFKDNIILHHYPGLPVITMASSIEVYNLNPWNKTNYCNNAHPDAPHQPNIPCPKPVTSNGNKVPCTSAGNKRNTMTPESGSKPSLVQCQKQQCRVITNNTVKHAQLDMGMFWLSNPKMKMNKIFPRDLREGFVSNSAAGAKIQEGPGHQLYISSPFFIGGPKIGNNQTHRRSLLGKEGRLV
jgi:hypothetical protein